MSSMITFAGKPDTGNPWHALASWLLSNGRGGEQGEDKALEDQGAVVYGHYSDNGDYKIVG